MYSGYLIFGKFEIVAFISKGIIGKVGITLKPSMLVNLESFVTILVGLFFWELGIAALSSLMFLVVIVIMFSSLLLFRFTKLIVCLSGAEVLLFCETRFPELIGEAFVGVLYTDWFSVGLSWERSSVLVSFLVLEIEFKNRC